MGHGPLDFGLSCKPQDLQFSHPAPFVVVVRAQNRCGEHVATNVRNPAPVAAFNLTCPLISSIKDARFLAGPSCVRPLPAK